MEVVHVRHAVYASIEPSARAAIAAALQALVDVSFVDSGAPELAAQALSAANLLLCDTTLPLAIPTAACASLPRLAVTQLSGRAARDQMFAALLDGVDHACSLANVDDFRAAVTTVLTTNASQFGLARLRAADDIVIFRRTITDANARHALVQEVVGFCQVRGLSGAALSRTQSVVDEILMNAQLDAPRGAPNASATTLAPHVEWMWQDNRLLLAVTDWFGRLDKRAMITAIARARDAAGAPNPATAVGAGVGLFLVMAHVGRFIVQVEPALRTEVVCVFDAVDRRRPARSTQRRNHDGGGVRAIHFFVVPPAAIAA